MDKKTYCAFPFNSFFLCANGDVKFCCSSRVELGNVNEQDIDDIMLSSKATEIRQSILSNEWHMENCGLCYEQENVYSGTSERLGGEMEFYWDELKGINDPEHYKLQRFDLRWSNTCQLACNYCFEYFSSRWANINGVKINANKETSEQKVLEFISKNKNNIKNINLLGGEPLLQKQNKPVFDMLPDARYYILTNLSSELETNSNAQKLLTMPNVDWGVSFETIGDKFEYVRHGAKWDKLLHNIRYVKEKTGKKLNTHSLWCVYNALDLMEFCDYVVDSECFDGVYWQAMSSHPALSVFSQSTEFKTRALEELTRVIDKYENHPVLRTHILIDIKEQLIKTLNDFSFKEDTQQRDMEFSEELSNKTFHEWVDDLEKKLPKDKTMKDLWPILYDEIYVNDR